MRGLEWECEGFTPKCAKICGSFLTSGEGLGKGLRRVCKWREIFVVRFEPVWRVKGWSLWVEVGTLLNLRPFTTCNFFLGNSNPIKINCCWISGRVSVKGVDCTPRCCDGANCENNSCLVRSSVGTLNKYSWSWAKCTWKSNCSCHLLVLSSRAKNNAPRSFQ